jgi:hypothetical protein
MDQRVKIITQAMQLLLTRTMDRKRIMAPDTSRHPSNITHSTAAEHLHNPTTNIRLRNNHHNHIRTWLNGRPVPPTRSPHLHSSNAKFRTNSILRSNQATHRKHPHRLFLMLKVQASITATTTTHHNLNSPHNSSNLPRPGCTTTLHLNKHPYHRPHSRGRTQHIKTKPHSSKRHPNLNNKHHPSSSGSNQHSTPNSNRRVKRGSLHHMRREGMDRRAFLLRHRVRCQRSSKRLLMSR